ncbi:MAG: PAS domain S-box protein [Candidatus Omnitrophica bacterium]|nr:PAS domain S-box protein [Candidatus Omnitrophota bacterium]
MRELFLSQMDYIFFVYGFSFICLAATAFFIYFQVKKGELWKWLGLFGLLHGIVEWLDLVEMSTGAYPFAIKMFKLSLNAASFLCLMEGARVARAARKVKAPGRWIYISLLAALAPAWLAAGAGGFNALSRYLFGFAGGLWLAWELARMAGSEAERRWLKRLALSLGIYVCTQLLSARAPFLWAAVVNQEAFLALTAVPIQLVRALLAFVAAVLVWKYYLATLDGKLEMHGSRLAQFLPALILGVIVAGGWLTEVIADRSVHEDKADILNIVKGVAANMDLERLRKLSGTVRDVESPDHLMIKQRLQGVGESVPGVRYVYLMGQRESRVFFFVDTEPASFASSGAKPVAAPGDFYDEVSPGVASAFDERKAVIEGPFADSWGTFVSGLVPVVDPGSGQVLAVLGMDFLASDWVRNILAHRLGVIFVFLLITLIFLVFFLVYQREAVVRGLLAGKAGELEEERRNLEMIFDSTQAGLLLVDSGLRVKKLNQVVLNMGGQEFFAVIGHQPGDALSCVQAKETAEGCGGTEECKICPVRGTAERILKTGETVRGAEVSRMIRTRTGAHNLIWLEVNATPMDIAGERHILFSLADITERKLASQALEESEKKHRALFEEMVSGFAFHELVLDERGQPEDYIFLQVNKEFERMVGLSREAVLGKKAGDVMPGIDKKWLDIYSKVALTGTSVHFVDYAAHLGKWFEVSAYSARRGYFAVTFMDVTEQKKKDDDKARNTRELEIFYKASIGREERILQLKKELAELKKELGKA